MGVTDVPVSLRDTALLHHFRGLKPTATIRDHSVVETPCACYKGARMTWRQLGQVGGSHEIAVAFPGGAPAFIEGPDDE